MRSMDLRKAGWMLSGLALLAVAPGGCERPAAKPPRVVGPGVLFIRMPTSLGKMRRPPVEFDHDSHTANVTRCKTCHLVDRTGSLLPRFGRADDGQSADKLMDFYHARCIGCHRRRGKGARGCGECHAKRPPTRVRRAPLRMDYSLHARHVLAQRKQCADCHHVFDKDQSKLVYKKGAEEGCASCHRRRAKGRRPSLRQVAHRACVSCHLRNKNATLASGPIDCAGCHTATLQSKLKRLDRPERLLRGQKDRLWVKGGGGKTRRVPFDHQGHEPTVARCSSCHHRTLASCNKCHTLAGDRKKGGGVTLAQAYHNPTAPQSCVGCHRKATQKEGCAGCHSTLKAEASRRSCGVCHDGPQVGAPLPPQPVAKARRVPAPLPAYSKAFPEWVTIRLLARDYQPSVMPHGRIVRKLHRLAGKSPLALAFHGGNDALCAGCHHHAELGTRPAPCSSCHNRRGHPTRDRPALFPAYHRQCIGCHQKMGLRKWLGCESCHKKKAPGAPKRGGKR